MAQAKVSDFFSTRKKRIDAQPSKKRKVELNVTSVPLSSVTETNTLNDKSLQLNTKPVRNRTSLKGSMPKLEIKSEVDSDKKSAVKSQRRGRKAAKDSANDVSLISTFFQSSFKNELNSIGKDDGGLPHDEPVEESRLHQEETTSAWDQHGSCEAPHTPPKRSCKEDDGTSCVRRKRTRCGQQLKDFTPEKDLVKVNRKTPARKKIIPTIEEDMVKENAILLKGTAKSQQPRNVEKLLLEDVQRPISPLPDTPEELRLKHNSPVKPTSSSVKTAMELCKEIAKKSVGADAVSGNKNCITPEILKERLQKCGKIEELKAQLNKMKETKEKLKKPMPELKKFDEIKVSVPVPKKKEEREVEQKVPAFEKYHSLVTPAAPSLTLPYKYKLLAEKFRSSDTVVSMLHNRSEVCTYSKLKAAVQEMTKRNFEEKNLGQFMTVFPSAYNIRQENNIPCFGKKVSGYQLTIEANFDPDETNREKNKVLKAEKTIFSATNLLKRRNTFHDSLIHIVKQHHKDFLSKLARPLAIPDDKITRWHPNFPVDEVADVEVAKLPEPPFVKNYQSAKDVLQFSKDKLIPRVQAALKNVASESDKLKPPSQQEQKPSKNTSAALQGVPQSILDKIRAKEAKKLEEAMTRDPAADKKLIMMRKLPDMMRILRTYFISEKKPSVPYESAVDKLAESYRSCISKADVETQLNLMKEVVPEWFTVIQIKKGRFIKIDRNIDMQNLYDKVQNMIKGKI